MSGRDRAATAENPEHPQHSLRETMAQVQSILAREASPPPLERCAHALQLVDAAPGLTISVHAAFLGAFVRDLLRMPLDELAVLRQQTATWTMPVGMR